MIAPHPPGSTRRTGTARLVGLVTAVLALLAVAAFPVREALYLRIAGTAESSAAAPLVGLTARAGLLVLVATAGMLAVRSWRRDRPALVTLTAAGVGVVGAYLLSEIVKLLVTEERPCRAGGLPTVLDCPAAGDWSWPSNHAVLAAAFATACVLAAPRVAWFAVPVALAVAAARVGAGVHYVHDVLSGLALGVVVVALVVALVRPSLDRLIQQLAGRFARVGGDR
ncbi:phosphatase PAP2 family protein [Nocardia farcinica]|uniref:phosphatase PAP2 family protein n=1 Tax=Nocardia farcinica TaxID=37329 RepID=UPI0018960876|nr:phosphatase PAP2 family protein [Nocardia farcinica]MBF6360215.1 phosphatase PAP2 family protein [Nocardia farcinica]